MKLVGIIGTAVLSLTLAAPTYAQQEQHDQQEDKDKPAEKKAQPEKPAKQEEKTAKPQEKSAQQERSAKPEEKNAKQEQQRAPEARPAKQDQRAGRIPDDRYKANFGQGHTFRVNQGDYSNRHFQYGGYSFGFVGVWPSNWLYTQNVYVIDIDGVYYLCNPMYPGVNIELNVTL
jgi:hypothetical protein